MGGHYGRVKGGYNGNGGYNGPKAGDTMVRGDTMVGADTMVHNRRHGFSIIHTAIYAESPARNRHALSPVHTGGLSCRERNMMTDTRLAPPRLAV